jgi:tetratricopeptide (TPR) repeat protein
VFHGKEDLMVLSALVLSALLGSAPSPAPEALVVLEDTPEAHSYLVNGIVLYKKRHFRAAVEEFRKATTADPQSAAAEYYLGYTLYKIAEPTKRVTPDKAESRDHFARAFQLDPLFRPTWTAP